MGIWRRLAGQTFRLGGPTDAPRIWIPEVHCKRPALPTTIPNVSTGRRRKDISLKIEYSNGKGTKFKAGQPLSGNVTQLWHTPDMSRICLGIILGVCRQPSKYGEKSRCLLKNLSYHPWLTPDLNHTDNPSPSGHSLGTPTFCSCLYCSYPSLSLDCLLPKDNCWDLRFLFSLGEQSWGLSADLIYSWPKKKNTLSWPLHSKGTMELPAHSWKGDGFHDFFAN